MTTSRETEPTRLIHPAFDRMYGALPAQESDRLRRRPEIRRVTVPGLSGTWQTYGGARTACTIARSKVSTGPDLFGTTIELQRPTGCSLRGRSSTPGDHCPAEFGTFPSPSSAVR